MRKSDLVSIICPNYNKGLFIGETIESVIANTYQNWELIIIDDGSTDNSISIIKSYSEKDPRILIVQQENKGGAEARNQGLATAKGEFLLFLDSDDLIASNCLERRISMARQHPDGIGWVFPLLPFKNSFSSQEFVAPWIPPQNNFLEKLIEHDITWTSMSPLWKTELIVSKYKWNPQYPRLQDIEFHTRILLDQYKIYTFPNETPDCFYRLDEQKLVLGNRYNYLKKWAEGCAMYVNEFREQLPQNLKFKISRTSLAFLSVAGHYYRVRQIDTNQLETLKVIILQSETKTKHRLIFRMYGYLLKSLPIHIPGLQRFFKIWLK